MTREFSKLSSDVKRLVQNGLYSIYRLNQSAENRPFLLVTSNREFFLLDVEGSTTKKVTTQYALSLSLNESVKFPLEADDRSVSLLSNSYKYCF